MSDAVDRYEPTDFRDLGDAVDRDGDPDAPTVIGGAECANLVGAVEVRRTKWPSG